MERRKDGKDYGISTSLAHASGGYNEHGFVNPAVYHASTVLFPDLVTLEGRSQEYQYGRRGTPTSRAFEDAVAALEGGFGCVSFCSGLAAVCGLLLAVGRSGGEILMTDSVYGSTRHLCDTVLPRLGVRVRYYDPLIGGEIASLVDGDTCLIFCESPGSLTMEVQDIPAICAVGARFGVPVAIDNTWSAGLYLRSFDLGCSLSIQAATKYICGHSDVMLGTVCASESHWDVVHKTTIALGQCAGPDESYMGLRGLRSLPTRLSHHHASALEIAAWLEAQEGVHRVIYPALPGSLGHDLWKRDFDGACGLFSILLAPASKGALASMVDGFALFGMGFSWGGYESLALPFVPQRTASRWSALSDGETLGGDGGCHAVRLHIGLEDVSDLKDDLAAGLERYRKYTD